MGLTSDESVLGLLEATSRFTVINNTCLATTTCATSSKYRSIDGSCNSLTTTNLGKSFTDYRRFTAPAYADGEFLAERGFYVFFFNLNKLQRKSDLPI